VCELSGFKVPAVDRPLSGLPAVSRIAPATIRAFPTGAGVGDRGNDAKWRRPNSEPCVVARHDEIATGTVRAISRPLKISPSTGAR
jgi:hypothetical protein